jgi:hypothetical protein
VKKLSFGQRIGKKPIEIPLQLDGITNELRIQLWNIYHAFVTDLLNRESGNYRLQSSGGFYTAEDGYFFLVWHKFLKRDLAEIRNRDAHSVLEGYMKTWFFQANWEDVFEKIEFYLGYNSRDNERQISTINSILEENHSGYRLVGGLFAEITNKQEISEIDQAVEKSHGAVLEHLKTAISLFSKGGKEGMRKSAGESLSAMEAAVRNVAGLGDSRATLPDAINELKKQKKIHTALLEGIEKIYSFGSNAGGMRHALKENETFEVDVELAKFLLVTSSATVNFLGKYAK